MTVSLTSRRVTGRSALFAGTGCKLPLHSAAAASAAGSDQLSGDARGARWRGLSPHPPTLGPRGALVSIVVAIRVRISEFIFGPSARSSVTVIDFRVSR